MSRVDEKIGMAIADARIADRVALQAKLVDHAPSGPARRIFENTACAFLIERLTGAPLFIADANSLKYFAVRFGRKFQSHREHNIIVRKRCMPVFEIYFSPSEDFYSTSRRPVDLNFADECSNLGAVGSRIHPQRAPDRSRNADQALHSAEVVLGAGRHCAAEIGGAIDEDAVALKAHFRVLPRKLQDDPR